MLRSMLLVVLTAAGAMAADEVRIVHRPRQTDAAQDGSQRIVVADPDAHGGTAQAAVPGRSRPGQAICSFYSYARPAGRYRCVWRLKIDDNTIAEPVFQASTGGGGRGYTGGSMTVKGTDFAAPRQYQDFSYTAEKGEGGFFAVGAKWPGAGQVLVDSVTVVSEELYTDRELVDRAGGVTLPDQWLVPAPEPPRIHLAKGLWWDFFGLDEALAELGGAIFTSSYHGKGQWGTSLRGFPGSWEQLAPHNIVVLANIDARALGPRGRVLLEEYVANGGSLLVLGGPFALQPGGYAHTSLETLVPCELIGDKRVAAESALVMRPGEAAGVLPDDLAWELSPRAYYYHPLEPDAGALVLVRAGEWPAVVAGTVGKGRVAVVAVTAEGDPAESELAFWEWGDMPRLMAAVCRWLTAGYEAPPPAPIDEETRLMLEQLAVPGPEDDEERQRALIRIAGKCRDQAFARELVSAVATLEKTPDRSFVEAVAEAVRPYADGSFCDDARQLLRTGNAGKAALGLRLLGMTGPEDASKLLRASLIEGVRSIGSGGAAAEGGFGAALGLDFEPGADERVRLGAATGLGDLGEAACIDELAEVTRGFSSKRQDVSEISEVAELNELLYQQSLLSRCLLGDATAVAPLLDAIRRDADHIEQFRNVLDVMLVNKDDKNLMHMRRLARLRLPNLARRKQRCLSALTRMPYAIAGELAAEMVRRNDPDLVWVAYAGLTPGGQRRLDADTGEALMPMLRESRLDELRVLAFRLTRAVGAAGLDARIVDALVSLAGADSASAVFSLRRLPALPAPARAAVLSAAAQHSDPAVRRLAALSRPLVQ